MTMPRCRNRHPMPAYTEYVCDGGHTHRVHTCGARIGSQTCAQQRTVPEPGPGCDDDESEGR